jgi:hypothetical protein
MHRVLKQALGQALRSEMLIRNPADAVDPPKVDWKPMQVYDVPQTVELIEAVSTKSFSSSLKNLETEAFLSLADRCSGGVFDSLRRFL